MSSPPAQIASPITARWHDAKETVAVVQGESKTIALAVKDTAGVAQDLTGATLYFTVQAVVGDKTPLITKVSTDVLQIAILVPKGGTAEIYLLPADTRGMQPGDYVFDVWVVYTSTRRYPVILPGTFRVCPTISNIP